jgi:predicted nuclease of predicted toxin-antitoxin system
MSRVRFLADHDLNQHILTGVTRGEPLIEFQRVADAGLSRARDDAILEYAAREGLVVVSHDVNTMPAAAFHRIKLGQPLAGLLMVKQSESIGSIIRSLLLIWQASELDEWKDQVVFLPIR